jgi:aminopeptidase C
VVKKTGDAEYLMEKIVSWQTQEISGKPEARFEVKWLGYTNSENTWEPYTNLTRMGHGAKQLFIEFVKQTNSPKLNSLLPKALRPKPEPKTKPRTRTK